MKIVPMVFETVGVDVKGNLGRIRVIQWLIIENSTRKERKGEDIEEDDKKGISSQS